MPRIQKERKPVELRIPDPIPNIDNWLILGLDPSVSRTGFAVKGVFFENGVLQTKWLNIGSLKPDKIEDSRSNRITLWIRSKQIALCLREFLKLFSVTKRTGLLISMEWPTAENDYLVGLNRILHVVLFEDGQLENSFGDIRILTPNASTLRSLMGLKQRGASNKKENILKAYTYVDQKTYPELDTDSCDAVLMAMMGEYAATILMGRPDDVPRNFLTKLTNAEIKTKTSKKGRVKEQIQGMLHHPEYWYRYQRFNYTLSIKDASSPAKKLLKKHFVI